MYVCMYVGLGLVTDKTKKDKPVAKHDPHTPMAAWSIRCNVQDHHLSSRVISWTGHESEKHEEKDTYWQVLKTN